MSKIVKVGPGALSGGCSVVNGGRESFMEVVKAGVGVTDKASAANEDVTALLIDVTEIDGAAETPEARRQISIL